MESMDCGQPIRFMRAAAARGADNFRFFADKAPEAGNGLSLHQDEHLNYTKRTAIGPVGVHHAVEHAVHVVYLEDRAGPGGRMHRGAQAGGIQPPVRHDPGGDKQGGRLAGRGMEHRQRLSARLPVKP